MTPFPDDAHPAEKDASREAGRPNFCLRPSDRGRRVWRRWTATPSAATLWRNAALSLWCAPPTVLWPLLLPILESSSIPALLAKYWETYLLFFGLPFVLGLYCLRRASRAG